MSKCMTIDETIDQKELVAELTTKDIVQIILEEAVAAAVLFSDRDCSRIGDFNIIEDFCQQFDQIQDYSKDFEVNKLGCNQNQNSCTNQELNLDSGESIDHSFSLLTARENLEFLLDSCIKKEEKLKNINDCKVISEEILANNEIRIENGQIHIEKNKVVEKNEKNENSDENSSDVGPVNNETAVEDQRLVDTDCLNEGSVDVVENESVTKTEDSSLNQEDNDKAEQSQCCNKEKSEEVEEAEEEPQEGPQEEPVERPFPPCTTEDLRQVWENTNSSIVKGWDMSAQSEQVSRLMEELSSVQVFPGAPADPNRPRACTFAKNDVNKMTKEIAEINLNQSHLSLDDFSAGHHSDGKGDADLEAKSLNLQDEIKQQDNNKMENFELNSLSLNIKEDLSDQTLLESKVLPSPMNLSIEEAQRLLIKDNQEQQEEEQTPQQGQELSPLDTSNSETPKNLTAPDCLTEVGKKLETKFANEHINEEISKENILESVNSTTFQSIQNQLATGENENENEFRWINRQPDSLSTTDSELNFHRDEQENIIKREQSDKLEEAISHSEVEVATNLVTSVQGDDGISGKPDPSVENLVQEDIKENKVEMPLDVVNSDSGSLLEGISEKPTSTADQVYLESREGASCVSHVNTPEETSENLFGPENELDGSSLIGSTCSFDQSNKGKIANATDSATLQGSLFSDKSQDEIPHVNIINFEFPSKSSVASETGKVTDDNFSVKSQLGSRSTHSLEKVINSNSLNEFIKSEDLSQKINNEGKQSDERTVLEKEMYDNGNGNPCENSNERDGSNSGGSASHSSFGRNTQEPDKPDEPESNEPLSSVSENKIKEETQAVELTGETAGSSKAKVTSEEELIDMVENVIQIIEPWESSNEDEDDSVNAKVSFSLLNEYPGKTSNSQMSADEGPVTLDADESISQCRLSTDDDHLYSTSNSTSRKKIFSGMTTIGPMKNLDHDPKVLTSADIDFGKMTRVKSSKLEKDFFASDTKSASSVKICDDSDEDGPATTEEEHLEIGSFVNRDIASLTKVQKVREVMSYHPKPEEDFEDDSNLSRPRLDLKDVESMTYERYNVPDVSIPLLSFDVSENNSEINKEIVQSMHLVLSGNCFNNTDFFEENNVESTTDGEPGGNVATLGENRSENSIANEKMSKLMRREIESETNVILPEPRPEPDLSASCDRIECSKSLNSESKFEMGSAGIKYGTLSGVFRKASHKFIRKESEHFIRNSKSLPRDATKLITSESIKSILDDCQTTAVNMLKKSQSLLKNTQSIFKTISHSRFNTFGSSAALDKQKSSPSESDVRNPERKFSFLKKEDFVKAKVIIKAKMQKTFKSSDDFNRRNSSNLSLDKAQEQVKAENDSVNTVNCEKLEMSGSSRNVQSKSSLILKRQIDQIQDVGQNSSDGFGLTSPRSEQIIHKKVTKESSHSLNSQRSNHTKLKVDENNLITSEFDKIKERNIEGEDEEKEQPDYIVMETVQGLPTGDLENSFPMMEVRNADEMTMIDKMRVEEKKGREQSTCGSGREELAGSPINLTKINKSSPRLPEMNDKQDKQLDKTEMEKKVRNKNKKFTRLCNFWTNTFSRVKSSSNKKEVP